jgi:hypothetical protein
MAKAPVTRYSFDEGKRGIGQNRNPISHTEKGKAVKKQACQSGAVLKGGNRVESTQAEFLLALGRRHATKCMTIKTSFWKQQDRLTK